MVIDRPLGWMREFWQADWSHLEPAIGYYDKSQVSTVERHIQQARENGLSYFSFYWPRLASLDDSTAERLLDLHGVRQEAAEPPLDRPA